MEQCSRDAVDSTGCGCPVTPIGGRGQLYTKGLRNIVSTTGGRLGHLVAAEWTGDCPQDDRFVRIVNPTAY